MAIDEHSRVKHELAKDQSIMELQYEAKYADEKAEFWEEKCRVLEKELTQQKEENENLSKANVYYNQLFLRHNIEEDVFEMI
jgi:hypothetical protein